MSQRGYTTHDIELIRLFGSPVRDGVLVTRADIDALTRDLQRLKRIEGTLLVEAEGMAVTIYRTSRTRRRRLQYEEHRTLGSTSTRVSFRSTEAHSHG
jgi:hypothetical protein